MKRQKHALKFKAERAQGDRQRRTIAAETDMHRSAAIDVDPDTLRLDRLRAVLDQRGDGRSRLYEDIQSGVWTPPVHLGRASAWPRHEMRALVRARIAEASDDQLRQLVRELMDLRRAMMPTIGAGDRVPRVERL